MKPSAIDPVCGMKTDHLDPHAEYKNETYFFCSAHCREAFLKDPETYLVSSSGSSSLLSPLKTYFPLLLILAYLLGVIAAVAYGTETPSLTRMMNEFMAGFFLIFSFFKLLDLRGFAEAYQSYDIVARRFPFYGWLYPFIELILGLAYLSEVSIELTHFVTLIVMLGSSMGVIQSLLRKHQIQCACLGTIFKLPMSKVTLFEDFLMAAMAAIGLISSGVAL